MKTKNTGYEIKKISDVKDKKLKELFEGNKQNRDERRVDSDSVMAENLQSYMNYLHRGKKKVA